MLCSSSPLLLSSWLPLPLEETVLSVREALEELDANDTMLALCCGCIGGFVCGNFKAAISLARSSITGVGVSVMGVCDGAGNWGFDELEMKVVLARLKRDCLFRSGVLSASRELRRRGVGRRGASFGWKVNSKAGLEKSDLESDAILDRGWGGNRANMKLSLKVSTLKEVNSNPDVLPRPREQIGLRVAPVAYHQRRRIKGRL
jgi:hypothetical protein